MTPARGVVPVSHVRQTVRMTTYTVTFRTGPAGRARIKTGLSRAAAVAVLAEAGVRAEAVAARLNTLTAGDDVTFSVREGRAGTANLHVNN